MHQTLGKGVLWRWGELNRRFNTMGSDNVLWPGPPQAIIRTNAGILLIGHLGTNFSEMLIKILTFSLKKISFESVVYEMAAILSRPQCGQVFFLHFYWNYHWNLFHMVQFICHHWLLFQNIRVSSPGWLSNCGLMTPHGNIRPGNSLLPDHDGTKPLPDPMSSHLQHSLASSFIGSAQGISL